MKRIVFIVVFMIVAALPAGAQVSFGVKAGANISMANLDCIIYNSTRLHIDNPAGYHFGFVSLIRTPLTGFYVRPEAIVNTNVSRFIFYFPTSRNADDNLKIRRMELDIPILAEYKISLLRFNAGPVLKFNFNDRLISDNTPGADGSNPITSKKQFIGCQTGVGVDIRSFTFDIRYNWDFSKTYGTYNPHPVETPSDTDGGYRYGYTGNLNQPKFRQGQVMFSLGYMF